MIGPWCFVDYFGPTLQTDAMVVAAHPHTGLQTVTWLFEGEIEHRDSLGTVQVIKPGQLNLMTAGHGIAHSELSLRTQGNLHAVQMWIALPQAAIDTNPAFEHQSELPVASLSHGEAKVLIGNFMGVTAPTTTYSSSVGVELKLEPGVHTIAVDSGFEHGILSVAGEVEVAGDLLATGDLAYVARGVNEIVVTVSSPATLMLIGGEPFQEKILMWWNFIGRTHSEIVAARDSWNARELRFGAEFEDRVGGWIPAPELPNLTLQSR